MQGKQTLKIFPFLLEARRGASFDGQVITKRAVPVNQQQSLKNKPSIMEQPKNPYDSMDLPQGGGPRPKRKWWEQQPERWKQQHEL
jgi:hypothetical protein